MQNTTNKSHCACRCGKAAFDIHATPFARFYCHCLICQKLYGQAFADVSVLWARNLTMPAADRIHTARYRRAPALDRSICKACGEPLFGVFKVGPISTLAFVPSRNFQEPNLLPQPEAHIFYHRRVADIDDALPKYQGYWPSEFAVSGLILKRMVIPRHGA